jgi:hypothetical protein
MVTKAKKVGVDTLLIYWTGPSFYPTGNWLVAERLDLNIDKADDN